MTAADPIRARRARLLGALTLALASACGGYGRRALPPPPPGPGASTPPAPPAPAAVQDAPPAPQDEAAAAGASPAIAVAPLDPPPPPARMPSLAFRSPRPGEAVPKDQADRYVVKLDVTDLPLSAGGAQLHVVLDDHPYTPVHDASASVRLGDIAPGQPLAEGEHVLVAFPGARDHVSIKPDKGKSPLARVAFWVGRQGRSRLARPVDREPRVVYSRPKGTYNGAAADGILLDFYLIDARIGPGLGAVRVTVTPPSAEALVIDIPTWTPHLITHLPDGDSRVRLELLDAGGKRAPGRWSVAEEVITVNRAATDAALEGVTASLGPGGPR